MSIYQSNKGTLYKGNSVDLLSNVLMDELRGRVNLIITSPPFPLNNKKKYGNQKGGEYLEWFKSLAPIFSELLAEDGSLVIEIGNAWEPERPVQSLLQYSRIFDHWILSLSLVRYHCKPLFVTGTG